MFWIPFRYYPKDVDNWEPFPGRLMHSVDIEKAINVKRTSIEARTRIVQASQQQLNCSRSLGCVALWTASHAASFAHANTITASFRASLERTAIHSSAQRTPLLLLSISFVARTCKHYIHTCRTASGLPKIAEPNHFDNQKRLLHLQQKSHLYDSYQSVEWHFTWIRDFGIMGK